MRFVYIASPYTKGDVAINVRNNIAAGNAIAEHGFIPFMPLLSHFWHLQHPHDYKFYIEQDNAWIERVDAVIRLPGESSGADAEVALAQQLNIPVYQGVEHFLKCRGRIR